MQYPLFNPLYIALVLYLLVKVWGSDKSVCACLNTASSLDSVSCAASFSSQRHVNSKFLFVTYISSGIAAYAAPALINNVLFFQNMSYPFRVLSEHTGHNYAPDDQRWNKVAIIRDMLRLKAVYKYEYIVYFDADLLFLDHGLNFMQIVNQYFTADIIMSDDSLDYANSGLIIAKNTPWSLVFFQRWWDLKDNTFIFCDQHALNQLSLSLEKEGNLGKLAVTPWWQLNSKWPALEHFQSTNQVLHLMGEYSQVRVAINFRIANSTCNNNAFPNVLIVKEGLLSIKTKMLTMLFNQHLQRHDIFEAFLVGEHVCEMQQRLQYDMSVCIDILKRLLILQGEEQFNQDDISHSLLLKSLVLFIKYSPDEVSKELVFNQLSEIVKSQNLGHVGSEALLNAISYLVDYFEAINRPSKAIEYTNKIQIPREEISYLALEVASLQIADARLLKKIGDIDSAVSMCIKTYGYVKALQEQYDGERRILANVVNSFVSVCKGVKEQLMIETDAIPVMKYMAVKE